MLKITHFHLEKNKNGYCKIFNSLYFPFDSTQKSNYILLRLHNRKNFTV